MIEISDTGTGMLPEVRKPCFRALLHDQGRRRQGERVSVSAWFLASSNNRVGTSMSTARSGDRHDVPSLPAACRCRRRGGPAQRRHRRWFAAAARRCSRSRTTQACAALSVRQLNELGYRVLQAEDAQAALKDPRERNSRAAAHGHRYAGRQSVATSSRSRRYRAGRR